MSYLGKEFILESQEGFEEFMDSNNDSRATPEVKKAILNHKGTVKLVKNGDEYTLITSQPITNKLKEVKFKSGVEFDDEISGLKCKTTITVDGDKVTTIMNFGEGSTFESIREFSDSQVIVTLKNALGLTAKRIYKPT
ncbi:hypothetical protein NE865_08657 [Phthorimaea operculella]|nr:hypothetical protein NE865_08657 [Phthorimaea operculella]